GSGRAGGAATGAEESIDSPAVRCTLLSGNRLLGAPRPKRREWPSRRRGGRGGAGGSLVDGDSATRAEIGRDRLGRGARGLGADLMTHGVRAERWVVMGRQVIAEAFAGRGEGMLADQPLNRWEPQPIAADDRSGHRLRTGGRWRRRFSLSSKRPHLDLLL